MQCGILWGYRNPTDGTKRCVELPGADHHPPLPSKGTTGAAGGGGAGWREPVRQRGGRRRGRAILGRHGDPGTVEWGRGGAGNGFMCIGINAFGAMMVIRNIRHGSNSMFGWARKPIHTTPSSASQGCSRGCSVSPHGRMEEHAGAWAGGGVRDKCFRCPAGGVKAVPAVEGSKAPVMGS